MRRDAWWTWCAVLAGLVSSAGCSVIFSDDAYRGRDGGAEVPDAGPGLDAGPPMDAGPGDAGHDAGPDAGPDAGAPGCSETGCPSGERCRASDDACVGCDADGDGFASDDPACDDAAGSSARDCDDDAPTVYPGAPPVCGDGRTNACEGTGLEVPDALLTALSGAEVGALETRRLAETTTGYFHGGHVAPIEGADGVVRLVATWAQADAEASTVVVELLDAETFERVDRVDLADVAAVDGFLVSAVRALGDGAVGVAAFRYGATTGEMYTGSLPAGATDLSGLTVSLRDSAGTCLQAGTGFALPRYPDTYLVMNDVGDVGGYNRYNEGEPLFFVSPDGTVGCDGLGFGSSLYLTEGAAGFFAFRNDNPSTPTLYMWRTSSDRVSSFSVSVPLDFSGPSSLAHLGGEAGSSLERFLFLGPTYDDSMAVVPIDCPSEALGGDCFAAGDPAEHAPAVSGLDGTLLPLARRLTARSAAVFWVEDRTAGATPPNTRVQELVMHVADRDGAIEYATDGDPGAGLPVLRYELDDAASDYRVVETMDAEIVRDASTGDLTIYALGVYSQATVDSFTSPESSEVRLGGARVCVTR